MPIGAEPVDLRPVAGPDPAVDDDDAAVGDPVVERVEDRPGVSGCGATDPQQGDAVGSVVVQCGRGPLHEPHPVVEDAEAGEPVAHEVEIRLEARDAPVGDRRSHLRLGAGPEAVRDPYPGVVDLVRVQVGPHEDRPTPAAGPAFHEVTGDAALMYLVERGLQPVHLAPAHGCVGQERRCRRVVGSGGGEPLAFQAAVGLLHVAYGVAQLDRMRPLAAALGREQLQPELVLEVVAVEQRVFQEPQVTGDRARRPGVPPEVVGVLEDHRPQARRLGHLEQLVPPLLGLEVLQGLVELWLGCQLILLHNDRKAEIDRDDQLAHRPRMLGEEVL